jgi:hypothetical protein
MIRILVMNLVLFLTPFFVVWAWTQFLSSSQPSDRLRKRYAALGLALVVASLVSYRVSSGNEPSDNYIAPYLEDGKIIPGRFE